MSYQMSIGLEVEHEYEHEAEYSDVVAHAANRGHSFLDCAGWIVQGGLCRLDCVRPSTPPRSSYLCCAVLCWVGLGWVGLGYGYYI